MSFFSLPGKRLQLHLGGGVEAGTEYFWSAVLAARPILIVSWRFFVLAGCDRDGEDNRDVPPHNTRAARHHLDNQGPLRHKRLVVCVTVCHYSGLRFDETEHRPRSAVHTCCDVAWQPDAGFVAWQPESALFVPFLRTM